MGEGHLGPRSEEERELRVRLHIFYQSCNAGDTRAEWCASIGAMAVDAGVELSPRDDIISWSGSWL